MEMQEVPEAPEAEDKAKGAGEAKKEEKAEALEEADRGHYSSLLVPTEEVYAEAIHTSKPRQELSGNTRLYRVICVCLSVICLILLMTVVVLGLKLQARSAACSSSYKVCNEMLCMEYIKNTRAACEQCPRGWTPLDKHCYYLSTLRLTWDESLKNCTKSGGTLAVITNQKVQNYLTDRGYLDYWIGLKQQPSGWEWVDKNMLGKSYWTSRPGDGDCALLKSRDPANKNWIKSPCRGASYYICQIEY
ncbi:C-type lectin domain family 4 member E [Oryzias melastigma]|uniref:C-type lectin domain family 4 member E n=1 Tax=Oryzias melastigma TaxID=30732 RepID=A0A834FJ85_ORYME|nr:C-type lectin domain family 4 member E [Oryzias melastigma]